ncbi:hemagglutinin repeat-containing protein, partial [Neisseria weixii]|uniref:hemagglutinin repeat-containing protein n=1 Tax=Neisseria weixii TaxID=1853276 RepID=UPI0011CEA55A
MGAQTGFYAYAEVGGSKGKNHYLAQTHDHTTLEADNIQLASQGDTTLRGATATANRIDADVKGRLKAEAARLDNSSGKIRSDEMTGLKVSDGLENPSGLIS